MLKDIFYKYFILSSTLFISLILCCSNPSCLYQMYANLTIPNAWKPCRSQILNRYIVESFVTYNFLSYRIKGLGLLNFSRRRDAPVGLQSFLC